ncbi:MAG: GNAT family N-acetyltransferase [Acidilobus sp.]
MTSSLQGALLSQPCDRSWLAELRGKYRYRPLCSEDTGLVVKFYGLLDAYSLYYRFLGIFKDFEGHAKRLFSNKCNYAIGAFDHGGDMVGLGEGFSDCTDAELAFAVTPPHRGKGIATVLASLLILEAYRRGMKTMEAYMHAENMPAVRIGQRLGLNLCLEEGGVYHGKAEVARIRDLALRAIEEKGGRLLTGYLSF